MCSFHSIQCGDIPMHSLSLPAPPSPPDLAQPYTPRLGYCESSAAASQLPYHMCTQPPLAPRPTPPAHRPHSARSLFTPLSRSNLLSNQYLVLSNGCSRCSNAFKCITLTPYPLALSSHPPLIHPFTQLLAAVSNKNYLWGEPAMLKTFTDGIKRAGKQGSGRKQDSGRKQGSGLGQGGGGHTSHTQRQLPHVSHPFPAV